jgi:hypothetical protein
MANWGQAFSNLGDSLHSLSAIQERIKALRAQQEEETKRQLIMEAVRKKNATDMEILKDPTLAGKPNDRMLGSQLAEIGKAKNPGDLGPEDQYKESFLAGGGKDYLRARPITGGPNGPVEGAETGGQFEKLHSVYAGKKAGLDETFDAQNLQEIKRKNPDGSESSIFVPKRQLGGQEYTTDLSSQRKGELEGVQKVAAAPGEIEAGNALENGLRKAKVQTASAETGARESTSAPYHPTLLSDDEGSTHAVKFGPQGGQDMPIPPGLHQGNGIGANGHRPAPASIVTMNASGNTAEITGVKILASLKNMGLDQSNNWLDPKVTQFMIGTLGMAPNDPAIADVNQRANYVQAALLRTLMAGRPSKYLAELYTKHIPSGTQSPKLLAHQLRLALEEGATQRQNMKANYPDLPEPLGGMTLAEWLKLNPDGPAQSGASSKLEQLRKGGRP